MVLTQGTRVQSSFRSSLRSCKSIISHYTLRTPSYGAASETHIRRSLGIGQARVRVYDQGELRIGDCLCGRRFFRVAHDGQIFEQKTTESLRK